MVPTCDIMMCTRDHVGPLQPGTSNDELGPLAKGE
jgi:hypothetical protein